MVTASTNNATHGFLYRTADVAYGLLETGFGAVFVLATGPLPGAFAVFDGVRRLYREAPQKVKSFFSGEQAAAKANKGTAGHLVDIAVSGGVFLTGLSVIGLGIVAGIFGGALAASTGSVAVAAVALLPFAAGAALTVGSLASGIKRIRSFVKERVLTGTEVKVQPAAGQSPLASKEVAPAFNAATEVKAENTPAKAPAPVITPPTAG